MPTVRVPGYLLLLVSLTVTNGFPARLLNKPQALGVIVGRDPAWINSERVFPATAFFPGDVIATGQTSTVQMNFRSGVTATVTEGSELAVPHEDTAAHLNVRRGAVIIQNTGAQPARVNVGATSIYIQGEGAFPAICRIAAIEGGTVVANQQGRVIVHRWGAPVALPVGQSLRLGAGAPPAGGQQAGKVAAAIPQEVVQRAGQTTEVALMLNDPVNWNDVVRTLKTGRVRLELLDGSTLNVGAQSTLRIVKHDADSQQTVVELSLGRLRSEVVKLVKPQATFEVRTQTAVVGVVGTVHEILATAKRTEVWCRVGTCTVRNIDPAVAGTVTLSAGFFVVVLRGLPPSAPVPAVPGNLQAQVAKTNVPSTGAPPAPAVGVPTPASAVQTTASFVRVGSGAGAASMSGVAATKMSAASRSMQQMEAEMEEAAEASAEAANLAGDAARSTDQLTSGVEGIADLTETGLPGGLPNLTGWPLASPTLPGAGIF
jgi:ferric-dicitrate binding protein FerR (iron transport regulator)